MLKGFSHLIKSDRQAALLLIALLTLTVAFFWLQGNETDETDTTLTEADSLPARWQTGNRQRRHYQKKEYTYNVPTQAAETFAFDPNTADSTTLLRLGLKPWQVRNIYKYRAKGGIYRKPSDFARLYGLTQKEYRRLEPYIRISSDYQPASQLVEEPERYERDTLRFPVKLQANERIALNAADTQQLKRVPGIGSGFARAIVGYRERLGGFTSTDQLGEISNFPTEAAAYFTVDASAIRKINLNKASMSTLRRHPYINYYRARAIIDYRRVRPITSLNDLSLLKDFPPEVIEQLKPYVEF